MARVALFEPEIAQNVGTIVRLAACFNMPVDLIHPLGFIFSSKHFKRAGMDYIETADVTHHDDISSWRSALGTSRIILFDTKGTQSLYDFTFQPNDILLFGKESTGVPQNVFDRCHKTVFIPINDRSLNIAVSAGIAASHYRKQFRL